MGFHILLYNIGTNDKGDRRSFDNDKGADQAPSKPYLPDTLLEWSRGVAYAICTHRALADHSGDGPGQPVPDSAALGVRNKGEPDSDKEFGDLVGVEA